MKYFVKTFKNSELVYDSTADTLALHLIPTCDMYLQDTLCQPADKTWSISSK